MVNTRSHRPMCLVTGGAGFLGRHIVDALVEHYHVSIFDVRECGDPNATAIIGDLRDLKEVREACKGGPPGVNLQWLMGGGGGGF